MPMVLPMFASFVANKRWLGFEPRTKEALGGIEREVSRRGEEAAVGAGLEGFESVEKAVSIIWVQRGIQLAV